MNEHQLFTAGCKAAILLFTLLLNKPVKSERDISGVVENCSY